MSPDLHVHHVKLDASGRIVLPADYRARFRLGTGDILTLVEDETGVVIKTRAQIMSEAQDYYTRIGPTPDSRLTAKPPADEADRD